MRAILWRMGSYLCGLGKTVRYFCGAESKPPRPQMGGKYLLWGEDKTPPGGITNVKIHTTNPPEQIPCQNIWHDSCTTATMVRIATLENLLLTLSALACSQPWLALSLGLLSVLACSQPWLALSLGLLSVLESFLQII